MMNYHYQTRQELRALRDHVQALANEMECGLFEVKDGNGQLMMQPIVQAETNLILAESIERLAQMFPRGQFGGMR